MSSRRGLFKGLRTDAARVAVTPGPVVEHFNVIEDNGSLLFAIYSLPSRYLNAVLMKVTACLWRLLLNVGYLARPAKKLAKAFCWWRITDLFLAAIELSALTGRASRLRRSDGVHDQHTALLQKFPLCLRRHKSPCFHMGLGVF